MPLAPPDGPVRVFRVFRLFPSGWRSGKGHGTCPAHVLRAPNTPGMFGKVNWVNIEIKYAKLTHLPPERGYHFLLAWSNPNVFWCYCTCWSHNLVMFNEFLGSTKDVKLLTSCISVCHVCYLNLAFLHLTILNKYVFTALTSFASWRISASTVLAVSKWYCSPDLQVGSMVGDPPASFADACWCMLMLLLVLSSHLFGCRDLSWGTSSQEIRWSGGPAWLGTDLLVTSLRVTGLAYVYRVRETSTL